MTDTQPDGFLSIPPNGKGHGVLVLHAWWGLNDTMKVFCERLAQSGFVAFAPDLYHGKVADNIADAENLTSTLDVNHLQVESGGPAVVIKEMTPSGAGKTVFSGKGDLMYQQLRSA